MLPNSLTSPKPLWLRSLLASLFGLFIGLLLWAPALSPTEASTSPLRPDVLAATNTPPCTGLTGTVYIDANANQVRDGGEGGRAGVKVTAKNTSTGTVVATKTTDANGNYSFSKLGSGKRTISIAVPTGYAMTTPRQVTLTFPPCSP